VKTIKRIAHRLFQYSGFDFLRYNPQNFACLRRAKMLQAQNIDLVLDIGSNEGTYPLKLRECEYKGRIISFEPLPCSFSILRLSVAKDPLWSCENLAVGDEDGTIEMNVSGHRTSSSILPISEAHLRAMPSSLTVRKEKVGIVRLDSLLGKMFGRNENIYLKIDVQGFERHVLEGARETLKQTRAIELELSLVPMYEGGAGMNEMLDYLTGIGFDLASLEPVFFDPKTGNLLQTDGIFVRLADVRDC